MFELDQKTQDIVSQIVSARKVGITGPIIINSGGSCGGGNAAINLKIELPSNVTPSDLNRLRRQFLNYTKLQTGTNMGKLEQIPGLFVQFLNSNCNSS